MFIVTIINVIYIDPHIPTRNWLHHNARLCRWLPQRLLKRQSPTTVLLSTMITRTTRFHQGVMMTIIVITIISIISQVYSTRTQHLLNHVGKTGVHSISVQIIFPSKACFTFPAHKTSHTMWNKGINNWLSLSNVMRVCMCNYSMTLFRFPLKATF